MDRAFADAVASGVATYVERHEPSQFLCKVRVSVRPLKLDLLAFVGRKCETPCENFIAELEGRGYVVVGQGTSEDASHWGVVVEASPDEDWADCVVYEAADIK